MMCSAGETVGWTTKTSRPRTLSLIRTKISPSANRRLVTSPRVRPRLSAISCASGRFAPPERSIISPLRVSLIKCAVRALLGFGRQPANIQEQKNRVNPRSGSRCSRSPVRVTRCASSRRGHAVGVHPRSGSRSARQAVRLTPCASMRRELPAPTAGWPASFRDSPPTIRTWIAGSKDRCVAITPGGKEPSKLSDPLPRVNRKRFGPPPTRNPVVTRAIKPRSSRSSATPRASPRRLAPARPFRIPPRPGPAPRRSETGRRPRNRSR